LIRTAPETNSQLFTRWR